jgi:uncharacterized protein YwgA
MNWANNRLKLQKYSHFTKKNTMDLFTFHLFGPLDQIAKQSVVFVYFRKIHLITFHVV